MKHEEVKIEWSTYEIGLTKVVGKKVKEVKGYLSKELDEPVFKLCTIEFEDGTILGVEGEHDFPYLTSYGNSTPKNYSDENLEEIYKSNPDR